MKRIAFAIVIALSFGLAVTAMAADKAKADKAKAATPVAEQAAAPAASPEAPPPVKYGINPGDNIKPVTVESIDGKEKVEVDKLKKKTMFVLITSVCTACRSEIQELKDNLGRFTSKMDVYGVVVDMDPASAAERIGPVPFPLLKDSDLKIGYATNLLATPSTLIVEDGKIVFSKTGYRPEMWKEFLK